MVDAITAGPEGLADHPLRGFIAPRVALRERIDDATGEQKVAVSIAPILGRVYEYAGSFRYEIRQGEGPSWANASS